jgi:glycerol-3-phosphate cytidylyltransferase
MRAKSIGREQLIQLQKRYGTDLAIAKRVGITRQAVYKLRKKYSIPASDNTHKKKRDSDIRHLYSTGVKPIKLAIKFNLSLTQIYRILSNRYKETPMRGTGTIVFNSAQELADHLAPLRDRGKVIVTTNGCFDILHAGHLSYLQEASELGDILVVGINSDSSVKRLKGYNRPINSEEDRATIIAALKPVDFALIFEEDEPSAFLDTIKPDIHVKGGDYKPEELPERVVVERHGGKIAILSFKSGHSTTSIIEKMRD